MRRVATGLSAVLAVAAGCGLSGLRHGVVDEVMKGAYRSPKLAPPIERGGLRLLAGDFHLHVAPPDRGPHVVRSLEATVALAEREGLDFAVLTPHFRAPFFQDEEARVRAVAELRDLAARLERLERPEGGGASFYVGFEYTDWVSGHAGAMFGDLEAILAELPVAATRAAPERFFERWVETGGLLVINHPFLLPLDTAIPVATWDLSWRPLHQPGPFPPEIEALHRLAQGWEAYNLQIAHLRDRLLLDDEERSLLDILAAMDREILRAERRIAPVGGSDSHSHHLRATTFVFARENSAEAIREAVVEGRTCVRSREACSLFVRSPGATVGVGGSLSGVTEVEVWIAAAPWRDRGRAELIVRGEPRPLEPREVTRVEVPEDRCTLIRARVGAGFSGPIYVNCPFAERLDGGAG